MTEDNTCQRQVHCFWVSAIVFFLAALGLLLAGLVMPLDVDPDPVGQDRSLGDISLSTLNRQNIVLLESRTAGRLIIRPAQAQAAVKDSGMAAELAKNLKLQGIANMPGGLKAYIRHIKEKRTLSVCEGEKVMDFVVRKIEQESVTLDLDGVEVKLTY